jgi:hypothetical protein
MPAAGGEDGAARVFLNKVGNRARSRYRIGQVIETEFEEVFAGFRFAPRLFEELRNVGQSERYANPG